MAGTSFKCSSCGGNLEYDPSIAKWKCPYCSSIFSEADVQSHEEAPHGQEAEKKGGAQLVYHCTNCGSEIITDETTVATKCYYCHSPIVLEGKLTDDMRPEFVLPFTIDKSKAVDQFLSWTAKKHYVPKDYFRRAEVEAQIQGVYFPYFLYDGKLCGSLEGEGRNTEVRRTRDFVDTFTHIYHVERRGNASFRNLMRPALSSIQRKITDGVQPYPLEALKKFNGAFLSGFMAERRNQAAADFKNEVTAELDGYMQTLLKNDTHYMKTDFHASSTVESLESRYVLVPVWLITYPDKKNPQEPYYYAMNGCTGAVCGKLPMVRKKLWLHAALIAAGAFGLSLAACYFLFA